MRATLAARHHRAPPASRAAYQPSLWEKITAAAVAVLVVGLVGWLVVRDKPLQDSLYILVRIILSLAVAVLGATIPGFLSVGWAGHGTALRAGGALALFVITYFASPAVVDTVDPNKVAQKERMEKLLKDMDKDLEALLTATLAAASAYQIQNEISPQQVSEAVERFNEQEKVWLTEARVRLGELKQLFPGGDYAARWEGVINQSLGTCQLLRARDWPKVYARIDDLRHDKEELHDRLRNEIRNFDTRKR